MMAALNASSTTPSSGPAGPGVPPVIGSAGALPELLGTPEVAKALGVSEADVIATLEKGDLKGKKIGSTWRVTKAALEEFLKT